MALCPGDRVNGRFNPLLLNPVPVTRASVIVKLDPPVLVSMPDWVWVVPICTLPKLTLAGAAVRLLADLPALTPWQASMVASASRAAIVLQHVPKRFISEALYRIGVRGKRLVCALDREIARSQKGVFGWAKRPILYDSL